jgi:hypothetical protein
MLLKLNDCTHLFLGNEGNGLHADQRPRRVIGTFLVREYKGRLS